MARTSPSAGMTRIVGRSIDANLPPVRYWKLAPGTIATASRSRATMLARSDVRRRWRIAASSFIGQITSVLKAALACRALVRRYPLDRSLEIVSISHAARALMNAIEEACLPRPEGSRPTYESWVADVEIEPCGRQGARNGRSREGGDGNDCRIDDGEREGRSPPTSRIGRFWSICCGRISG